MQKSPTVIKLTRLLFEYLFYYFVINTIFIVVNYRPLGLTSLINGYIPIIRQLGTSSDSFPALFIVLYLFMPFINKLTAALTKRQYQWLLGILLFVYSVVSTFLFLRSKDGKWYSHDNWEGIGWYMTAYLIGGYIRLHLSKKFDNLKTGMILTVTSLLMIFASILFCTRFGKFLHISYSFMYTGSNKFLAVFFAFSVFILFKNIKMPNSKIINTISATSFPVLLIHANSDTMRQWLWKDTLDCVSVYSNNHGFKLFVVYALMVLAVYTACVLISLFVQHLFENRLLDWLQKKSFFQKQLFSE